MRLLDKNLEKFVKGYMTQPGLDDPTYLGFTIVFDFNNIMDYGWGEYTSPLLAKSNTVGDNAMKYLENIDDPDRARMMHEFIDKLKDVQDNAPYFFQSIEGLDKIWHVNKTNENFSANRGLNKILTVSCLESIDMRMTAIADLYRKASFDYKNMRMVLPHNLRLFSMYVFVSEFRKFHQLSQTQRPPQFSNNLANQAADRIMPQVQNSGPFNVVHELDNVVSTIGFHLGRCEFDFEDSWPAESVVTVGATDYQASKLSFKINVGTINEINKFTLQDLVIVDHGAGTGDRKVPILGDFGAQGKAAISPKHGTKPTQPEQFTNTYTGKPVRSRLDKELDRLVEAGVERGTSYVEGEMKSQSLGNVYGKNTLLNSLSASALDPFTSEINKGIASAINDSITKKKLPNIYGK